MKGRGRGSEVEMLGHITGDWRRWEEDAVEDEGEIEEMEMETENVSKCNRN